MMPTVLGTDACLPVLQEPGIAMGRRLLTQGLSKFSIQ